MSMLTNMASEPAGQDYVTVKGIKSGLIFKLADDVHFEQVLDALTVKLGNGSSPYLSAGKASAYVDFGNRELTPEIQEAVEKAFVNSGVIQVKLYEQPAAEELHVAGKKLLQQEPYVYKGTLRAGQIIEHDGDVVVIGNVNPGAHIIASGDIYVFGRLRGYVHAGASGNVHAIVAAAYFEPMQVRIAGVIRRSPEAYAHPAEMEFAHLEGDQMAVEKMSFLQHFQSIAVSDRAVI